MHGSVVTYEAKITELPLGNLKSDGWIIESIKAPSWHSFCITGYFRCKVFSMSSYSSGTRRRLSSLRPQTSSYARRLMKHKRPLDVPSIFVSLSLFWQTLFIHSCKEERERERATEDMMALICCRPEFRTENMTVQKSAKRLFFTRRKYLFSFFFTKPVPFKFGKLSKMAIRSLAWSFFQECNIV